MKTDDLRRSYLEFFQSKGHTICQSDVLVPTWDPTVLFTPAGMNQFKDHFLGKVELEFTRATTCQKCLRTGDIDNVGRTPYHHTFFEMLGNFSFGDYFKREAILWAWEFLTSSNWLALPADRLSVTVYLDDDEAAEYWRRDVGLPPQRITRKDEMENFWPAGAPTHGPDGVCGPCSEIYYHPAWGGEVEIWNLVFTQFNRVGEPPQNLQPLPSKNIDTGMGLERAAATLQGVHSNYDIDILKPIVLAAAEVCGVAYDPASDAGRRLRRITDHIRAATFAIHENVYPGSHKEQYVVKRLLRRAVLDGHQLGVREPFLYKLVPAVVEMMKAPYPELRETAERVARGVEKEEQSFFATIDGGLGRIAQVFETLRGQRHAGVDGQAAAELYQTYGIPPELVESLAADQGFQFDWDGFRQAMARHSEESGKIAEGVMGNFGPIDELKAELKSSRFVGYDRTHATTKIVGLVAGEQRAQNLAASGTPDAADRSLVVVLEETPFYAESGGQVGDRGRIDTETGSFAVVDTQRDSDLILHYGHLVSGTLTVGQTAQAAVDAERRQGIRRAHSATHVLHYALQKSLGRQAQQRGSKVDEDWLRFDFMNQAPVTAEQLQAIEHDISERIREDAQITAEVLPLAEAKRRGAMMLFGEKYPDPVRMISMGEFSRELCGGTHLQRTGEIQRVELLGEEGVSAGTRRVTVLTGAKAAAHAESLTQLAQELTGKLGCPVGGLPAAVADLWQRVKSLRKLVESGGQGQPPAASRPTGGRGSETGAAYRELRQAVRDAARQLNVAPAELVGRVTALCDEEVGLIAQLQKAQREPTLTADQLLAQAMPLGDVRVIVAEVPGGTANSLRLLIDQIRQKSPRTAVLLAAVTAADKLDLVAGLTRDLVESGLKAGDWVKTVAPLVGGGGGGKPDVAQAGGKQPENLKPALQAAVEYIRAATVK